MKAATLHECGAPSVLRYEEVPDPVPGDGEILIRVEAISLEGGDLISRRLAPPPVTPHIVGYQAAGPVIAAGPGVRRFRTGDRVATFNIAGSHAALRAVPEALAWAIPDGLDSATASTVPVTFGTADDALFETGKLQAGETVLITGGAGGVGIAAIQLAKAAGATVLATASGGDRLERLRGFGMDHGIDYRAESVRDRCLALTAGRGVDLVIDVAGGPGFEDLLHATAYRGRLVTLGAASGAFSSVDLMTLTRLGLTVSGTMFGRDMATGRAREIIERHLAAVANGTLHMPIHRRFPLAEAAAAHEEAEHGHPFGRIILIP